MVQTLQGRHLSLQVLDEAGVLRQVSRFAGSGFGALVATLLALGFSPVLVDRWLTAEVPKLISGSARNGNTSCSCDLSCIFSQIECDASRSTSSGVTARLRRSASSTGSDRKSRKLLATPLLRSHRYKSPPYQNQNLIPVGPICLLDRKTHKSFAQRDCQTTSGGFVNSGG